MQMVRHDHKCMQSCSCKMQRNRDPTLPNNEPRWTQHRLTFDNPSKDTTLLVRTNRDEVESFRGVVVTAESNRVMTGCNASSSKSSLKAHPPRRGAAVSAQHTRVSGTAARLGVSAWERGAAPGCRRDAVGSGAALVRVRSAGRTKSVRGTLRRKVAGELSRHVHSGDRPDRRENAGAGGAARRVCEIRSGRPTGSLRGFRKRPIEDGAKRPCVKDVLATGVNHVVALDSTAAPHLGANFNDEVAFKVCTG